MFETVTVDEAIKRGKQTITYPALVILFGTWIVCFYLGVKVIVPAWFMIAGIALGLIFAWLYRCVMATRWRIWAFYNVRNVHELQKRAIKKQILSPDGKFFARTEIWTADQKAQWATLQDKFMLDDIFTDDHTVPAETVISFSKNKAGWAMVFGAIFLAGSLWLFQQSGQKITAGAGIFIGALLLTTGYRNYVNRNPQIILSNDGVQIINVPFYSWADVTNEDTELIRYGKSRSMYFKYNCPEGEKRVKTNELDISASDLEKLLRVYRGRYTQKHRLNN